MAGKFQLPKNYRYSETHEWIKVYTVKTKKKGKDIQEYVGTIGVTEYAIQKLGDLVHIDLPKEGEEVEQGQSFGEIESVKTVAELYSLISGKVVEVNTDILENMDLLKEDPHDDGWLIKVAFKELSDIDYLMDAEAYNDYLQSLDPTDSGDDTAEDEDFFL